MKDVINIFHYQILVSSIHKGILKSCTKTMNLNYQEKIWNEEFEPPYGSCSASCSDLSKVSQKDPKEWILICPKLAK